ncbi:hypothetical protein ACFFHH_16195 [Cytobacillus solani]|uniref:hypothetical protein n=1 Tax=Cytobacillus solani TaxID=1637975 RepID=UPI000A73A9CB|nr:hypothetical protein [Cytobacillus solani]
MKKDRETIKLTVMMLPEHVQSLKDALVGMFIQKDTSKVIYETPSKKNLRLVKIMNGE